MKMFPTTVKLAMRYWFFTLIVLFSACEQNETVNFLNELSDGEFPQTIQVQRSEKDKYTQNRNTFCEDVKVVTFLAGQHIEVGDVEISNDEEDLYVTLTTHGDWFMTESHLLVGSVDGIRNPAPGRFPYKTDNKPAVQTYTYVISLVDLGSSFNIAAHAEVVLVNGANKVTKKESAWGEGTRFTPRGNWAMYTSYEVQTCEVEEECATDEAWSAGFNYTSQGGSATYTLYTGVARIVDLIASQNTKAGTVSFSGVSGGMVTITITLDEGWSTQEIEEPVKIQGYSDAPTGIPNPENFTTYKGKDLIVRVPPRNFYGIHIDTIGCK